MRVSKAEVSSAGFGSVSVVKRSPSHVKSLYNLTMEEAYNLTMEEAYNLDDEQEGTAVGKAVVESAGFGSATVEE